MGKYKDLTGQRFGLLTARELVGKNKYRQALWRCECDCGNEKIASSNNLHNGDTKSCGCLHEKNLEGQRFGKLVAIKSTGRTSYGSKLWLCKCDCGNEVEVITSSLVRGLTRSCGCLMREIPSKKFATHRDSNSRLYYVWQNMKDRCYNPNNIHFYLYGGRGISVCDEWRNSYESFQKWALENGYDETAPRGQCTLDRIDNNGNYEPSNCRWATAKEQCQNRRPRGQGLLDALKATTKGVEDGTDN